jgi:DNA repair protein RecO (recombination protein O)
MAHSERSGRLFRTDAIILRRQDFKEYDRLVTLFTPEYGKFTVVAKGVRRPTGRNTGHVELFTCTRMLIARGRDLGVLNQSEMTDSFLTIREDLERAAYAHHVVELLDRFTEPEEAHPELYGLLLDTIARIADRAADLRIVARHYELSLLALVGFQPELFDCVIGHESLEPLDQYFSAFDGGAICPEHAENNPHALPMSLPALKVLRFMQQEPFEMCHKLQLNGVLHLELERILHSYIVFLLERRLKSVDFIRRLRHEV